MKHYMKIISDFKKKDHIEAGGKSGEGLRQEIEKREGANICQNALHRALSSQNTPTHLPWPCSQEEQAPLIWTHRWWRYWRDGEDGVFTGDTGQKESSCTAKRGGTGDSPEVRNRLIWGGCAVTGGPSDVRAQAAAEGHTDLSDLHCHLGPWLHPGLYCHQALGSVVLL